jgi:TolA-binding protein
VKVLRPITALAGCALVALAPAAALGQRQQATPEQRIDRLERQVNEMQRRVYPKGRPADTAGFSDDPAATQSSVISLDQRIDALERQIADMLRQGEENGNRLRTIENGMSQLKSEQDQRMQALEQRINEAAVAAPVTTEAEPATPPATVPAKPKPKASSQPPKTAQANPPAPTGDEAVDTADADPGEEAYSEGFHQWEAGQYDQAVQSLRAFVKAYPKHPRVSFANNLIGRALLDAGNPRAAAEALLANYRKDPGGARAPDSLYYLGQALAKLGQTTQACKAYAELDAVYGAKIRPDLKKLEADAKAQSNCS